MKAPDYWIAEGAKIAGPFAESQLLPMWRSGQFTALAQCCVDGTEDWI